MSFRGIACVFNKQEIRALVKSVEISRRFDSTRRFDRMWLKTDDLGLFRFVIICNIYFEIKIRDISRLDRFG
jgi:hypothetical protein